MTSALKSWLEAGLRAQQAGDLTGALAAYEKVLRLQPEHPDACQLMGMLARQQGDERAAEQWLRRSLAAHTAQPAVWNRLGNLLLARGRQDESLQAYATALQLQPRFSDALYNQARALQAMGRTSQALASLNAAVAMVSRPGSAMLQLQAQLEADAGRLSAALATLDRALQDSPDRAALWHNRAVLLQRTHRHAEALMAHERAAALGLDAADAHYNLGNTLQSLGRLEQAAAAYRAALQRQPQHALALLDLARLRWRQADPDFDAELRLAMQADPAAPVAAGILGSLLWRAERYGEAAEVYREALRRAPGAAEFHDGLARCLVRLGEVSGGLAAHLRALALAPEDAGLRSNQASSLLVCGQTDAALQAAEVACRLAPQHQTAQALRMLAWRLLGDPRAAAMAEAQRWVQVIDLPAPEGWSDRLQFNQALAKALRALHGDRRAPIDQTLRGGTQTTDNIFEQGHPLVDQVKARIAQAVTATIAGLRPARGAGIEHPYLARCPTDAGAWRFTSSWSSRLTQQGFHTDHVHPDGWMSSVYYVQVPAVVGNASLRQGWLRFGVPDLPLPGVDRESLVQHMVQPAPGRLVLFPSMMWHGTTPFDEAAERITLAFDLVPS